jgi:serine/threonine protein kinase
MAPEQIQGRPSTSSDQYSLGVVVYEWLCGRPPFGGSSMEIALQHVSALPPLLREKDPTIPADVEKVVLTALAKEPAQRFGSVQAFATTLEQARQRTPSYVSGPSNSPPGSPAALQAELYGSFGSLPLGLLSSQSDTHRPISWSSTISKCPRSMRQSSPWNKAIKLWISIARMAPSSTTNW